MTDQGKLTEDEMILQTLSAEVRTHAREIIEHATALVNGNPNAVARELAQAVNHHAGRLSALVHQRELTLARVMRDRGTPITFVGPAIRWCNAMVPGTGPIFGGMNVKCNRMLRDDGSCRHQREHIPATKLASAADCPGAVFGPDAVCRTCGHPAEQHSNADDLGDTQAVPADAHRHIDHNGRTGPLCTAPVRADGTCTVYPPSQ